MPFLTFSKRRRAQVADAGLARHLGDLHARCRPQDDLLDIFAHRHHLVDADAALVAVVAAVAADCVKKLHAGVDFGLREASASSACGGQIHAVSCSRAGGARGAAR